VLPKSILGTCAPTARIFDGLVLAVLKSFFDKSGQEDQPFFTLAGIAAPNDVWAEVEGTWNSVLNRNDPRAEYMHMAEAVPLRGHFSKDRGWNDEHVFGLVNLLVSYITQFPQDKYCQVMCTIDMAAYRKLAAETYQLDSPVDICNTYCVQAVMSWYRSLYRGGLDYEASYYFDTGEPFEPAFKAKWEEALEIGASTGTHSIWSHIKHVGTLPMRENPGLQIADMLAWGRNREECKTPRFEHIALTLTRLAPTLSIMWDEERLRKRYSPLIYKPYVKY
jgi:hypothetical protein